MRFITGPLNKQLLHNLLIEMIDDCTRVRAAVAYASRDNMQLFEACAKHLKPLEFYGRYDYTVAVDPSVLRWFLDKASPNYECRLVPDILHAKVIWWVDAGAYIGSANLSDRAWISNIEAGTFLSHDELVETGMGLELQRFFDDVEDRARPLTREIYLEQLRLSERRADLSKRDYDLEQQFDKSRLLPKNQGLVFVDTKRSSEKRFQKFEQDWNDTLQVMRAIASRVSAPGIKPAWIETTVAAGVQADQFLHAYYYKQVKDGNRHPYEEFFSKNSKNPELALRDALEWWKQADFDHSFEERTIYDWSPRLRELLSRDRILRLTEDEFIDAISRVHAIRDHAVKQENEHLGLPDSPQAGDDKVQKFGEWLWQQRSHDGKSILDLLNYVVWGNGSVAARLWNAIRSEQWAIPHIGLSSLGEIVGWARPDEFPPRNMRTSKGLRALGYNVRIGV
ncbi:phospholipase [Imbroritus primus]|uniref:Phospholipase n=1 Tax=Imbroritus primus TaxID=3058603 RepID=A0ACD3SUJ5_9BURK|nr:phospholipase [Burkholderiaceae bacterium PBA]